MEHVKQVYFGHLLQLRTHTYIYCARELVVKQEPYPSGIEAALY